MTPEQRSEAARKAAATRRRRRLEQEALRSPQIQAGVPASVPIQTITSEDDVIDLSLPKVATKTAVRRSLEGFDRLLKEYVKETKPRKRKLTAKKSDKESLVIFFSDTHFGKVITDEEDKSKILFNAKIGAERVKKMADVAIRMALQRDVDEIVILMGGDMIDGEGIYFTQAMHIEQSAIEQVKETSKGFFAVARDIHAMTNLPVRIVGCPGNHGRTSKTADELSNWDQMIYVILDLLSQQVDEPISVEYPSSRQFIVTEVKGNRILLRHKAKRGTTPSPTSQWQNWLIQHDFDVAACGHWHTPSIEYQLGRPVFRSGSLCGKDDFAESLGLGDEACQWIWGMKNGDPMTFAKLITFEE